MNNSTSVGQADPVQGAITSKRNIFTFRRIFLLILVIFAGCVLVDAAFVVNYFGRMFITPVEAPQGPQSIKAEDGMIKSVEVSGDTLIVRADLGEQWDSPSYVIALGEVAQSVGKAIQHGPHTENLTGVTTVMVQADAPTQDRLGNAAAAPFAIFSLPVKDLRAANYANLQWAGVLDLADHVQIISPAGLTSIAAFCASKPDSAPHFCAKAMP